jgi:hypothetical protein
VWARFSLGRNFSAMVTITEDHKLKRTATYGIVTLSDLLGLHAGNVGQTAGTPLNSEESDIIVIANDPLGETAASAPQSSDSRMGAGVGQSYAQTLAGPDRAATGDIARRL